MRRMIQFGWGAAVVVALVVGGGASAQAAEASPTSPASAATTAPASGSADPRSGQVAATFARLAPFFTGSSSGYARFDATAALSAGVDPQLVADAAAGFASVGGAVVGGSPAKLSGVTPPATTKRSVTAGPTIASAACPGVTKSTGGFPAIDYSINACDVRSALAVFAGGASVAGLIGKFAKGYGSAAAAVVAAIIGFSAGIVAGCNARGRGIVLTTFAGYATGCRSQ